MVDTLADTLMLRSSNQQKNAAVAISMKSRAAIGLAGHAGTAIWFDHTSGNFTTSKAYADTLPAWLTTLNNHSKKPTNMRWQSRYPTDNQAYAFPFATDYSWSDRKSLFGISTPINQNTKEPYKLWAKTPEAQRYLLTFAEKMIQHHYDTTSGLLYIGISLSGPDKLWSLVRPRKSGSP